MVPATPLVQAREVWALSCSLAATGEVDDFLSVPTGTEMFQFPAFPSMAYVFSHGFHPIRDGRFPDSEIPGSRLVWQLPEAYRSLPRPSSASGAKTSTVRP